MLEAWKGKVISGIVMVMQENKEEGETYMSLILGEKGGEAYINLILGEKRERRTSVRRGRDVHL